MFFRKWLNVFGKSKWKTLGKTFLRERWLNDF
jgi:hypothetical protein